MTFVVDLLVDAMSDDGRITVIEIWLPSYVGGSLDAKVMWVADDVFTEQVFKDTRSSEDPPLMARWLNIDGRLFARLAMLFVEREGEAA